MSCDTEGRRDRLRQRTTARTLAAQNGGAEEEVLSRQSTKRTIYGEKSPSRAGVAREERPISV